MWEYEGFIAKAQLYFTRGREHPAADDDVLAHWLLLGLEFVLRAPLAKIHPALLAEPNGNAIMNACGVPSALDSTSPKSIQTKAVILRLGSIVPGLIKIERAILPFSLALGTKNSTQTALL
jgi:hypothetical protein